MLRNLVFCLIICQISQLNLNLVDAQGSNSQVYGSIVHIGVGHSRKVFKVIALGENQDLIASSGNDTTVRIWNATSPNPPLNISPLRTLSGHMLNVWALAAWGNGYLASGSVDRTIKIWDVNTGELKYTLPTSAVCIPNKRVCNFNKLVGHVNDVNTLCAMPNYQLASGSFDSTVRVWDVFYGTLLKTFIGHTKPVKKVLYLPYNDLIASVSFDGTVRIWDPNGASNSAKFVLTDHTQPINTITDLADGRIVTTGNDSRIYIWSTITGQMLHTFTDHTDIIHALVYLNVVDPNLGVANTGYLVSGGKDRTLRVWDVNSYTLKYTFPGYPQFFNGHRASVYRLIGLPNGLVASCAYDKTIKLWDTKQGMLYLTYSNQSVHGRTAHASGIMSATYIRERMFATGSLDSSVRVWRYDFTYLVATYKNHTRFVTDVKALEDGYVASCSLDYLVKIWKSNVTTNETLVWTTPYKNQGHSKQVNSLAHIGYGIVASGSDDWTVKIWNWRQKTLLWTFREHKMQVNKVLLLSNGLLTDASNDATINVYNLQKSTLVNKLTGHFDSVTTLVQLDNNYLVSGSADFNVMVWDTNNNFTNLFTLKGHTDLVYSLTALTNNRIASGSFDMTALVWDGVTGTLLLNLTHGGSVTALAQITNGYLASGSQDKLIRIWNIDNASSSKPTPVTILLAHLSGITCLSSLPNNFLISGSSDAVVRIWNVNTNQCIGVYDQSVGGHTSQINAVAVLQGARYFASGSNDNMVKLWLNSEYL